MACLLNRSILVKEMEEKERETVRRVLVDSYQQFEAVFDPERWTDYLNELISSIDHPNIDKLLVAKRDKEVLGSLQLFPSAEKAYTKWDVQIDAPIIRFLGVHPLARGLGVGRELLKAAISYLETQRAASVFLHTTDTMEQAIKLYESFGFIRDLSKEFYTDDRLIKCYRFELKNGG
ncbi:hypothetical protein J6TS1_51510 [Siminovitchia terrae]|uniref:N-acetyltransferase domain-containing protein n=1 Tax=Siminovitchia terrae TaxID=1914933 RepID=A0ABQ4L5U5_SIMTE|nr:GNAT family N-acetyltransferase [Siminovitchia terrae]GIN93396.1 hypothetical protein J22TS1_44470 [Siminovitchia terrae]GIN99281.1 hypothetical protein J6TS1_51510 [Siminovitchia terrae]